MKTNFEVGDVVRCNVTNYLNLGYGKELTIRSITKASNGSQLLRFEAYGGATHFSGQNFIAVSKNKIDLINTPDQVYLLVVEGDSLGFVSGNDDTLPSVILNELEQNGYTEPDCFEIELYKLYKKIDVKQTTSVILSNPKGL